VGVWPWVAAAAVVIAVAGCSVETALPASLSPDSREALCHVEFWMGHHLFSPSSPLPCRGLFAAMVGRLATGTGNSGDGGSRFTRLILFLLRPLARGARGAYVLSILLRAGVSGTPFDGLSTLVS
jgi:hypothetical protein